jgi:hypothetical protein
MKKEKKGGDFLWQKVFLVMIGVLFAGMMIISAMGPSWLQSFRTVRVNDSVTLDFTLLDPRGQPVLTTDENTYRAAIINGGNPFLTSPLTVRAGNIGNPAYTGVDAVNYYLTRPGTQLKFGILGQELDDLSVAVLGMKTGEKKTSPFSFTLPTIIFMDYEFTAMGGNFTSVRVGDSIPLGFSESPVVSIDGQETEAGDAAMRIGTVINKTGASIGVDHQYPTASITIRSIA